MSRAARPGPSRYTDDEVARMVRLYQSGLSLLQVATKVGCDHSTVIYQLKRLGIARRTPEQVTDVKRQATLRAIRSQGSPQAAPRPCPIESPRQSIRCRHKALADG